MKPFPKVPRYIPYLAAFLLSVLYFLFQFHHVQRYLDWDQIVYANNIIGALKPNSTVMFNYHHLHLEIGGKWFHQFVEFFFKDEGFIDVTFNNRLRAALAGSIGIFFMVVFLKEITGKLAWGILGGILVGFCHGYLSYATKVDTAIYPATGMILILWIFHRIETAKKWSFIPACAGGIILFASVMFHQYMGIACLVSVITLVLPPFVFPEHGFFKPFSIRVPVYGKKPVIAVNRPFSSLARVITPADKFALEKPEIDACPRRRYVNVICMALIAIILISAGYFYAGETTYNLPFSENESRNWRGPFGGVLFQKWLVGYAVLGTWGRGFKEFHPRNPFYGYTRSFLVLASGQDINTYDYRFNYNLEKPFDPFKISHNLVAYFTLITIAGCILLFPLLLRRYKRCFILTLLCFIFFSLFTTYWESYYYEFWLVPCLLVCVLGILLFNFLGEKLSLLLGRLGQYPSLALIMVFTFFISMHNIQYHAAPYSRNQVLGGISSSWPRWYYMDLFSTYIFRNPTEPYKDIYKAK